MTLDFAQLVSEKTAQGKSMKYDIDLKIRQIRPPKKRTKKREPLKTIKSDSQKYCLKEAQD